MVVQAYCGSYSIRALIFSLLFSEGVMASESSMNGGQSFYTKQSEPEAWRGKATDNKPLYQLTETGAKVADRKGCRTPSLSQGSTTEFSNDSGLSCPEPGQFFENHERGWPNNLDHGGSFGEDANSSNGFSEEHILNITFDACDTTGKGEVQASKVMQYLQDMTAQSPHQGKLKTLYDMLDPEQKDHAVTRDTFHSTMRMWIGQCCQSSMQEDYCLTQKSSLTMATINGNDVSPSESETEAEGENETEAAAEAKTKVEFSKRDDECYCEWKDLLSTVDELKHARQRLSEQNRSLLRSMAQSEDTNLQLTLEITQLRAKLLSAQRATVRARSLSEELDEARRALKESQERLVQAQASTCTLNERFSHERTCEESRVVKLMRMNAEMREELDETLTLLAEKDNSICKKVKFIDELKISHLENLRIIEGLQLELMRLQDNSRQELLRFDMCTVDPQSPQGGCNPVSQTLSLQSEIQETQKGGNIEGGNSPICGLLPQYKQRVNFQGIPHQIRERELELQRDLREEVEGKLEEANRQTEMAKKTAAINWWRALKVEEDRTKAQEEASQASHSRDKAMERLQKAEATVQELQDKVHCLQAALRTTSQQTGNDEEREAAFPKVDASHQSKRKDVGVATDPMEESVGCAADGQGQGWDSAAERAMETWRKVEAMVNHAVKAVDLLHVSEGRIRQARERVEAASERVERVLSKAADAEAKLSEVETRILEKPEPTGPSQLADQGSAGMAFSKPRSKERPWNPTELESVSQFFQVHPGHTPNGGIISPGAGGGNCCTEAQDSNSYGTVSLTDTPTQAQVRPCSSDSQPSSVGDDSTGPSVPEPVSTQTACVESEAQDIGPVPEEPLQETQPAPNCKNAPESVGGSLTDLRSEVPAHSYICQSKPAGNGKSQAILTENPTPTDSVKAEENQIPRCANLRQCDSPPQTAPSSTSSAPHSVTPGTPFHPRIRPPLTPAMPTLPEEEEDSPEDLDSSSSSPVTSTPVGNKVVTMAFPTPSIVLPRKDVTSDQDSKPLEHSRPHSPRPRLSRNSSSSGPITTVDSTGNVIDLVKDQLPELQLSAKDKQKNLELLEEAKRVSDRFLSRRGRRSTSSLSESPTGGLSPNPTPQSSPVPSRSSSLTVPPQTAGLPSISTPHSSPVPSRSNSLTVPPQNAPEELGVNYVNPPANQQEDISPQDQEGLRKLVDWKPSEKRKVSSGTLAPRHAIPVSAREGSIKQRETCEPHLGGERGGRGLEATEEEGPRQGPPRRGPDDEAPATGVAKPVPRPASQQAPCTAEIKTIGAFPPLMRAVSWDTVGSFPGRSGGQGSSPKNEEALSFFDKSSESLFKSSGYKDFPVQPVKMQKLAKMREENKLIRNQSIVGSKLPELSETAEQERGPSPCPPPASPTEEEAKEKSDVMPNISDIMLRKLKLHRGLPGSTPPLTEKEVENAFVQLSLAFRNDNYTLETRLRQAERERNLTEENTEKELEEFKGFLKSSVTLWQTSEQRESYQRLLETVAVLHRLATRLSSRAEMVGAVRQEKRMNKATEVMMQYVENLKRTYEKDHAELMEFKKLANQNSNRCYGGSIDTGDDGVPRTSRSMSVTLGKALPRRRVSVAVVPKFNLLNIPGQTPPNAAGPLLPVLCEANNAKGSSPTDPAQQALAESGKTLADQEGEASTPAKPPCSPAEISSEVKAKIEEDAYNKGYQEGLKRSKELQELKEAEEKTEESQEELEEKEKDREMNEIKEKKYNSKYEKVLDILERLCPKLLRQNRLFWIVLTLFAVTFFLVNAFTYFTDHHSALGDVSAGKAMGPGKKKFFGWNMRLQPKNPTPE
ncbi:hypothetical protein AGOR_G00166780 [Albula goreensis]|uniref:Protein MRVI1 n=1 Tax=Albula goreensis TaxID=1534307 RepID=A0A8T3D1F5_9TELE|nr:hypothetical protein AGOR_G00166780 [Albula goreensis]